MALVQGVAAIQNKISSEKIQLNLVEILPENTENLETKMSHFHSFTIFH